MEAATSGIWRRLPTDAHAAMAELWAELLLRRLAGRRARSMVTSHDHEHVQDRATPLAAASYRLHPPVLRRRQIRENQESTRRQYDLACRARQMGWPETAVRVIDELERPPR